jgi:dimethylglycine dehydrogenase
MKSHARVVVIGGGILGCGLLYHLTKLGWRDVVLVEKNELTAGTTWHSAGLCTHFSESVALSPLPLRSTEIYQGLEAETGQPGGFHKTGSVRLALDQEQMTEYLRHRAKADYLGIVFEMIGPDEIKALFPLIDLDGVVGAAHTPEDGHVDPSMVTQAFAHGARAGGAEIYRQTKVEGLSQNAGGEWRVVTDKGTIGAEIVVNAAGMWAPEIGAMAGVSLPVVPMELQYLVTEAVAGIEELDCELPVLRELDGEFYVRQEGRGLMVGIYENEAPFWAVDGIPSQFGQELLPPDLDRAQHSTNAAIARVPVLGEVGVKRVICGPTARTPDQNGLMGPLPGLGNHFILAGFSGGITQGGAASEQMAEWIVEGEPSLDLWSLDVRRFGGHADKRYTCATVSESHTFGYKVHYPNQVRFGGRPAKTSPLYHRLKDQGGDFQARYGWECPNLFLPDGAGPVNRPTFGRPDWFDYVGQECRAVRQRVGIVDLSPMAKYEVSGPATEKFLDRACANSLPREIGDVRVSQVLTPKGRIACHMAVTRLASDRFYLAAPAAAEVHHLDCLRHILPADGVSIDNITGRTGVLLLAGPRSREVLAQLTDADLSDDAFPYSTARDIRVGFAPVRAVRINSTGEMGWELHHPIEYQVALYESLMSAGEASGIVNFGLRALDSMRLEKGAPVWGLELTTLVTPLEAGLDHLVDLNKGTFVGREALVEQNTKGPARRLACLTIEAGDAYVWGGEPVLCDGRPVGLITSAGHGHVIGAGIAMAYLPSELATPGTALELEVVDQRHAVTVVSAPLYKP